MPGLHRARVEELLAEAEVAHRQLLASLPQEIGASLPVDAQGITRAIDYLADALGFTTQERRRLVAPHAVNPAVLHARVFGAAPLTSDTVLGAFVEGARVRAGALLTLAEAVGEPPLLARVNGLLMEHPLPAPDDHEVGESPTRALQAAYAAQERAALLIASGIDAG